MALTTALLLAAAPKPTRLTEPSYLPDAAASRAVTVTESGPAAAGITVLTAGIAIKETGPRATVARFGEVYAFFPAFVAVHRDEPTEISFWNLQPDDDHDFMLVDADSQVLMKVPLPALRKTTYVFSFHQEGLFMFYCTMHQPEMSGQILSWPRSVAEDHRVGWRIAEPPELVGEGRQRRVGSADDGAHSQPLSSRMLAQDMCQKSLNWRRREGVEPSDSR